MENKLLQFLFGSINFICGLIAPARYTAYTKDKEAARILDLIFLEMQ